MKRVLAALVAVSALAACAREVETDQARLCRMALPALAAPDAKFAIDRQSEDEDGRGVAVFYRDPARHEARCRFQHAGRPSHSKELTGLWLDGAPLSDTKLFFLIRFWLATPEGRAADPAPLGRLDGLPQLPPAAAYALQSALDALPMASVYALLSVSYALIYGLIGRITLAFGALAAAGGYGATFGAAWRADAAPLQLYAAMAGFAALAATVWGLASGAFALAPLARASGQRMLVASVGLLIFLEEAMRLAQGAQLVWTPPALNAPFALARAGDFLVTASPNALSGAAVALAAGLALILALRLTRFGRAWRAYADDPLAAALFGVDPRATFLVTFGVASALAGVAGFTLTATYGAVGYGASATLGLKAAVAAILGGAASVPGAWVGGLALGALEAGWSAFFPSDYRDALSYALLAALLALRPSGLFGAREDSGRRWA